MKNTAITLLTGLALATAAQAGSDYSAKGKDIVAPPAPSCLWSWFAGGSYGQIGGDWDEDIYTLHFGAERKCPGSSCSHAIYLEVGFTEKEETIGYVDPNVTSAVVLRAHDVTLDIIPITLNYKYECALTGNLNWFVGAGAGVALVDLDIDGPVVNGSEDETVFYAHVFAGLTYNVSESFEVFGGARYIFMDDAFDGGAPLDSEIHYDLGVRFNF